MARYIDADALYKETEKKIAEANSYRMAVVDGEFLDLINDAETEDVVPKSEVYDDHHKQVTCYTLGCREGDKIKREAAREIFEEIEKLLITNDFEKHYGYPVIAYNHFGYAELKKKYTEENK